MESGTTVQLPQIMGMALSAPQTYGQWMECLEYLGQNVVRDEDIHTLQEGICPGVEHVLPQFLLRIQDTVNLMLNRSTRWCTKNLNELMEEGDFSSMELLLRRSYRDMEHCRFYRNVHFIPQDYRRELDEKTVSEIRRYWEELRAFLINLSEETGNSELEDMVFYINRLMTKDHRAWETIR